MNALSEIEAIKRLKHRYFRCLDRKDWTGLADCFSADATAAYDSGRYSYDGRPAILEFLSGALGSPDVISLHHGHHPEIEVDGTTATGIWYLEDYLIFASTNTRLRGAAFYEDRYVREAAGWKISHTGYVRSFEEIQDGHGDPPRWVLTRHGDHLINHR